MCFVTSTVSTAESVDGWLLSGSISLPLGFAFGKLAVGGFILFPSPLSFFFSLSSVLMFINGLW